MPDGAGAPDGVGTVVRVGAGTADGITQEELIIDMEEQLPETLHEVQAVILQVGLQVQAVIEVLFPEEMQEDAHQPEKPDVHHPEEMLQDVEQEDMKALAVAQLDLVQDVLHPESLE